MSTREFIILPRSGLRPTGTQDPSNAELRRLPRAASTGAPQKMAAAFGPNRDVTVIDAVSEDGPRLVQMDDATAAQVNAPGSVLRAAPLAVYGLPNPRAAAHASTTTVAPRAVTIVVTEAGTGAPLADAQVIAFESFSAGTGDSGTTDATGSVTLNLRGSSIDRLYVYTELTHWGCYRQGVAITAAPINVQAERVDLNFVDAVRRYYGASNYDAASDVTVGVIDTGVGPHTDLNVLGGRNTVTGEAAGDYLDWDNHGTHVAGLIGSNGAPPTGLRGVAPGVGIRAYRVFGNGVAGASNYSILKAMIFAGADNCDIVNLSLGGGPYDPIVEEAVKDARDQGMLVIIAAGNDGRRPVSYPAAYAGATAVSALGREGTFPPGALAQADVLRPPPAPGMSTVDPDEFITDFSNVGPEIAVTGLGCGVLSTLPGNAHGPMSGTSMAAPVVAGATAALLSQNPAILGMARTAARAASIERLLQTSCTARGFGLNYEGYGLPDPALV